MDVFAVPVPNHGSTRFPALRAREAARCCGAAALRVGWLVAAMTILGCPGGSPPQVSPTDPIVSLSVTGLFTPAGQLSSTRTATAVVALPSGGALRIGGSTNEVGSEIMTRVEEWDPAKRTWSITGHLASEHRTLTATRFPDGRVLVAGGGEIGELGSEVWVPGAGSRPPAGDMVDRRSSHTATLLADGRVLIAGGLGGSGSAASQAELFDPATETFAPTGSLVEARYGHAAVLLTDGRVLVLGGVHTPADSVLQSAELWDPATGQFTRTGDLATPREGPVAVLLGSGEVLVAGGLVSRASAAADLEIWDPATGAFRSAGEALPGPRSGLSAHLLDDARVLLVGGEPGNEYPVAGAFLFE